MEVFLFFVFLIVVLVIISKNSNKSNTSNISKRLTDLGIDSSNIVQAGKYVSGHPEIDKEFTHTVLLRKADNIVVSQQLNTGMMPSNRAYIPIENIKDIAAEDASTFERRVTLGRVLLTGVFALAWRKKKKNEMAFLTIEWNDGRFDHSTVFNFEGFQAMQSANTARNQLIKWAKT
nr:hypothetical protein [uncultured Pedobacter sp.]